MAKTKASPAHVGPSNDDVGLSNSSAVGVDYVPPGTDRPPEPAAPAPAPEPAPEPAAPPGLGDDND